MTDMTPEERDARFRAERDKVGDGWNRLIDDLYGTLGDLLHEVDVLQIKEMYGGLRFYILLDYRYANLNLTQALLAIAEAERSSLTTCESCGEPGNLGYHAGWYKTLCPKHHEELEDVMADAAQRAAANWLGVKARGEK